MSTATRAAPQTAAAIDPPGPRFTAAVSAVLLAGVLVLPSLPALFLTAALAALFAAGALLGVQHAPTAWVFRTLIQPRLRPPEELEGPKAPRFAQGVGLLFAVVALAGFASGLTLLAQVSIGLALAAALLNAVFGFCLGCEIYLLLLRWPRSRSDRPQTA